MKFCSFRSQNQPGIYKNVSAKSDLLSFMILTFIHFILPWKKTLQTLHVFGKFSLSVAHIHIAYLMYKAFSILLHLLISSNSMSGLFAFIWKPEACWTHRQKQKSVPMIVNNPGLDVETVVVEKLNSWWMTKNGSCSEIHKIPLARPSSSHRDQCHTHWQLHRLCQPAEIKTACPTLFIPYPQY